MVFMKLHILFAFFFSLIIFAAGVPGPAAADESCISCHTSENKLTRNLSKGSPKKSALTSGAG